jgi:glycerophosphoryl diester phosphodiesterase
VKFRPQIGACLLALLWLASTAGAQIKPLPQAHAHNDYLHARPLLDALDLGFCGVEADIYLVGGKLLVAHEANKVSPVRTLEGLYLEPLRERIKKNGGQVHPGGPGITLLIDIKSEAGPTYAALREVLKRYADILTVYKGGKATMNAVTVIISGNRTKAVMVAEPVRYAALDGRLEDLDGTDSAALIPWMSDNWTRAFKWRGTGPMPGEERARLKQIVERAHQQGRRVRFWATPDRPEFWRELAAAGVDVINTDDLAGLRKFLAPSP